MVDLVSLNLNDIWFDVLCWSSGMAGLGGVGCGKVRLKYDLLPLSCLVPLDGSCR